MGFEQLLGISGSQERCDRIYPFTPHSCPLSGAPGNGGIWGLSSFYGSLSSGAVTGEGECEVKAWMLSGKRWNDFWGILALGSGGEGESKPDLP